jgi:FimV-like protein
MRRYIKWLVISLFFLPMTILAMTLGTLKVSSFLNQPLLAEIQLEHIGTMPLASFIVQLASPQAYKRMGLSPPSQKLPPLIFKVISNPLGKTLIQITTVEPINLPIIEFLLQVNAQGQEAFRDYAILLNPATAQNKPMVYKPSKSPTNSPYPVAVPAAVPAPVTVAVNASPNVNNRSQSVALPWGVKTNTQPALVATTTPSKTNADNLAGNTSLDLTAIKEKLVMANALLASLQQKNEFLTLRLQDVQTQMVSVQKLLLEREKRMVALETQLGQYQALPAQVNSLKNQFLHFQIPQTSSSWISWQGILLMVIVLSGMGLSLIYWQRRMNGQGSLLFNEVLNRSENDINLSKTNLTTDKSVVEPEHASFTSTAEQADLIEGGVSTPLVDHQHRESLSSNNQLNAEFSNANLNINLPKVDPVLEPHLDDNDLFREISMNQDESQSFNRFPEVTDTKMYTINTADDSILLNKEENGTTQFSPMTTENNIDLGQPTENDAPDEQMIDFESVSPDFSEADSNTTLASEIATDNLQNSMTVRIDEKIDLALAYLEFQDNSSAKTLLDEVLIEGSDAQKLRAQDILEKNNF